jgi:hypothetical protein
MTTLHLRIAPLLAPIAILASPLHAQTRTGYCFDCVSDAARGRLLVAAGDAGTHVYEVRDGIPKHSFTLPADGGYHRNLKVSGDVCWIADAKLLYVAVDLSKDPPSVIARGDGGSGMGIDVRGDLVCIASSKKGLSILRRAPSGIEPAGACPAGGDAWDVWIRGDIAFVANVDGGVGVVDIGDPAAPRLLSTLRWGDDERDAEVARGDGNLLAVAGGSGGLALFRLDDPRRPAFAGKLRLGSETSAEGLAVRGGLIYLACGDREDPDRNGLLVVDARDPSMPSVLGAAPFAGWTEGVCLQGDLAFVANTHAGVRSVDVRDPARPKLLNGPPPMTPEEKETVARTNGILKRVLRGRGEKADLSTPGDAYIATVLAAVKNDLEIYRDASPAHWKQLRDGGKDLSEMRGMHAKKPMDICRILSFGEGELALASVYTGVGGQPLDIHIFALHGGRWRKLFGMGKIDESWRDGVPKAIDEMRRALGEKVERSF